MVARDEQHRARRDPTEMVEGPEQRHGGATGERQGRGRARVLAAGRAVVVEELSINRRRALGEDFRRSHHHRTLATIYLRPALRRDLLQGLPEVVLIQVLRESLARGLADVVHADRGDGLDTRIDLGSGQAKTATAADADDADAVPVDQRIRAKVVDGGAEVLDEGFRRG